MLKISADAIKTLAKTVAQTKGKTPTDFLAETESPEITYFNRRLREAFGLFEVPQNMPLPASQSASDETKSDIKTPAAAIPLPAAEEIAKKAEEERRQREQKMKEKAEEERRQREQKMKEKAEEERRRREEEEKAAAEKKRQEEEAARKAEEEKARQLAVLEAERAKKAEEERRQREQKMKEKAEEERRRREEEEKAAAEKKRQEEEAARKAEEEKARQLAVLEAERAKKAEEERRQREQKMKEKAEEERRRREEEEKAAAEKKRQEEEAARKAEEEKARQLAVLEAERAKKAEEERRQREQKMKEKAEEERRRREEEEKAAEEERRRLAEERRKKEEEMAANSLPVTLKKLLARLEEKRVAENKKAAEIPAQKMPLEQKRRILESKIAMIRKSELAIVEEKEREIEARAAAKKNELEKSPDHAKEKTLKQSLWQIEDSRKEIEKQRWAVEDKINKIKIDAESVDRQIAEKVRQMEASEKEISRISGEEALVRFAAGKIRAEEEILKIIGEKESLAPELAAAKNKKNDVEKKLADLAEKEKLVSRRLNDIETEEASAKDLARKREIEKSRWQANSDLKSIVEEKWNSEEKLNSAAADLKLVQEKMDSLDAKIESIQNKITAAEIELEEKELPVHALRDAIRRLLEENSVNFNPKIISRIVQIDKDGGKPNSESKAAAEKTPLEKVDKKEKTTTETAPSQANDTVQNSGTASEPAEKKPVADAVLRAEKVPPKENTAQAAENDLAKNKTKNSLEKEPPNEVKIDLPKPDAAPATAGMTKDTARQKSSYETKTPTNEEIAKMAEHNGSVYREQVEAAPARNIRTFSQEDSPKTAPAIAVATKESGPIIETTTAEIKPIKTAESEPEINEDGFAANPENRWQQIKKTTLPAAAMPPKISPEEDLAPIMPEEAVKSKKNNLLARILIVLAVIAVFGTVLAVILIKNGGETPTVVKNEPKPAVPTEKNPPEKPAATIVTTISTVTIYVDNIANIPSSISPYLKKKFDANGYHALSIIDKNTGKKIGLKQFFNAYKVNAPSVLYNSIKDDGEFFIYANNGKNRIGFAAEIANAEMIEPAMAGWEGSIVKDTENLFRLSGRKAVDESGNFSFTDGGAAGATYKIMNFPPPEDEFAIAWANYRQTYFIFSTSNNSMAKIFNQLPK